MVKYPKVPYYCEETIYELTVAEFQCRFWFDTNGTDFKNEREVFDLAVECLPYDFAHIEYAQTLANAMKPHGLNALSVKVVGQPAYMIYTTPFQEGESA